MYINKYDKKMDQQTGNLVSFRAVHMKQNPCNYGIKGISVRKTIM